MQMTVRDIQAKLAEMSDPQEAAHSLRFFKTGKGEYGEGDLFRGIHTPPMRQLARECRDISLTTAAALLKSKYHEDRALALIVLVGRFKKGDESARSAIYSLYMSMTRRINNWDLVDISAEHIVGAYLYDRDRAILRSLAKSEMLWERRIAIIATLYFIRKGEFDDTLRIARMLLGDTHDLMHKAVGWMLRETGKRDLEVEEKFLRAHYMKMPRTMLRYAIEKFPEPKRQAYLKGKI